MDQIQHKFIEVRGLKLHVAEIGSGTQVVVFLHGFPEIWYSWRHQMIAVSKAGFRAIAPDHRGYGLSDAPQEPAKATFKDLIYDLHEILDCLDISQVVLVAKDFGASPAYLFSIMYPERVLGIVSLGVPFSPPTPSRHPYSSLPEGFYMSRWKEPGRAEADFGRFDAKAVVKKVYIMFSKSNLPIAEENQEVMDIVEQSAPLPPWFSEEDLAVYGSLYGKSGFQTALQVPYRSVGEEFNIAEPVVKVPVLLIVGGDDYVLKFPGLGEYIKSGKMKEFVPKLETVDLPDGTHFVQEQLPEQVNELVLSFLNARIWS